MEQPELPAWESELLDDSLKGSDDRPEGATARRRALQLAREQAYHRLAVAIDRPAPSPAVRGQLRLWPEESTLFDDAG